MTNEMNESPPPASPDNEYMKQVLARYEASHGSFIKQSTIFSIFVFSFLAFILVPILSLKVEVDRVVLEIEQKPQKIAAMQEQDDRLRAEAERLTEERNLINGELTSLNFERAKKEEAAEKAKLEWVDLKGRLEGMAANKTEREKRLALLEDIKTGMG